MGSKKRDYSIHIRKNILRLRLLLTISVFVCIPLLFINVCMVRSGLKKLEDQKKESFQIYTKNFREFFCKELDKMFACSLDLSINKTITERDVTENSRYLWNVFSVLRNYKQGIPVTEDVFIYIRSVNYVLGSEYGYGCEYFSENFLGRKEEWMASLTEGRTGYHYYEKDSTNKDGLFVIYPVSVQKQNDSVILFYITPETIRNSFFDLSGSGAGLYIFDSEGNFLLSNNGKGQDVTDQPGFLDFVLNPAAEMTGIVSGKKAWYLSKSYDAKKKLSFVAVIPAEEFLQPMKETAAYDRAVLLLEFFLCIILLLLVVSINYKPIHTLKKKYPDRRIWEEKNEIDSIAKLLDRSIAEKQSLSKIVQEHTSQISAYVLRDMLNGDYIPEMRKRLFHIDNALKYVFVTAVQGIDADSDLEEEVSEKLADGKDKIVYMMTDSYEHCLLFVCMLAGDDQNERREISEKLQKLLIEEALDRNFKIGVGEYCSLGDELKDARLTAFIALDQSTCGKIMYYENALNDFRHVEYYPNRQMLTYMRYLREGNKDQALCTLEQMIDSIRESQLSVIIRQYICYDIVNDFIKLLTSLEIKAEEGKILTLMRFETLDGLCEIMADLTAMLCQEVDRRKQTADKELVQQIVSFIEDNLSNPDLSREMIAARFRITTNAVSLLCTNIIGCGFRELIVAHRVELARELLRNTDLSVNDVAVRSGFRDASYFIKIFKSITGKTPRNYKDEFREQDGRKTLR